MDLPIVVIAWNRDMALRRILGALSNSKYSSSVKLFISIDGGGSDEVERIAKEFVWNHGEKIIIKQPVNIGLRNHVIACGDLALKHDGIVILEDDLYVSPHFYDFALQSVEYYKSDQSITGVSLYSHCYNEISQYPFYPLNDGHDVFFMQLASSWGQCWTRDQWFDFRRWYDNTSIRISEIDKILPPSILKWPESSWKKYFIKYMIEKDLYFVYPFHSLITNFGDQGVHHVSDNHYQVPLIYGKRDFNFIPFNFSMSKYDIYCEMLPSCLKRLASQFDDYDFDIDLYGSKPIEHLRCEYVLTSRSCTDPVFSFERKLIPHEANIIAALNGDAIVFCKKENVDNEPQPYNNKRTVYFHRLPRWHIRPEK
jgi:hypothetical protein